MALRQIPCTDAAEHDAHPDDIGQSDIVGEIDLPDGAPLPAWTASARCEGCAVRRGLMEPRPALPPPTGPDAPEPPPADPPLDEGGMP